MNITEPLRVATGSHQAGSGKGCAMNVVSWMNGDTTITDLPDCSDPMLARIVQRVNDSICTHRDGDLLCPECSVKVIELGTRTIGTGGPVDLGRRVVWVRVAARMAREVAHLNPDPRAMAAIEAAEAWADNPTTAHANAAHAAAAHAAAAYTAYTAAAYTAYTAATYTAYTAEVAANAATNAAAAEVAANAAEVAADAATNAAWFRFAHLAIDVFNELTGRTERPTDDTSVIDAYRQMVTA